jgi:hypothetical protein
MIKNIRALDCSKLEYKATVIVIDFTDGYRIASEFDHKLTKGLVCNQLRQFAALLDGVDEWIEHDGSKRIAEGRYWVMSSYGVRNASYHNWGECFQDSATSNDEDMRNTNGDIFTVSHYMPIVEPKPPLGVT